MLNHMNPKYSGGIPLAIGDRYYAQDMFRDMRYYQSLVGDTLSKIIGYNIAILEGLEVSQGTGHTIDITAGMGIVPFTVTIPDVDDTWALPPITEIANINMFAYIETSLTDQDISGANTDGVTTNYVKLAYAEDDGNTRTRIKSSGTYAYEVKPSYILTVNDTTPTGFEITLATFTTDGVDITFTYGDENSVRFSSYQIVNLTSTLKNSFKYLATGSSIDLTLPSNPSVGNTIEVYSLDNFNNIIPNTDQAIIYNDDIFTRVGEDGSLNIPNQCNTSLLYTGANDDLIEVARNRLANPSILPSGFNNTVAFSPDGNFMAVAHDDGPYVTIYEVDGITFTKLPNPSTLPTGSAEGVAFSDDGNFLAVAHSTSPYVTIYSISGTTFTKLPNPSTLPTGAGNNVDFSHDSSLMAVAHSTSPYVTIYSISGTTFTKLPNPSDLPSTTGLYLEFSDNGNFLGVTAVGGVLVVYEVSGTTFTKIPDGNFTPSPPSIIYDISFSSDGNFMSIGVASTPYIYIYSISGTTFTKITNPSTLPGGSILGTKFSPTSEYLALTSTNSPFIFIYSISGTTFTKIDNPDVLPNGASNGVDFSPNSDLTSVVENTGNRLNIYKGIGNNQNLWSVIDISPKNGETIADLFT